MARNGSRHSSVDYEKQEQSFAIRDSSFTLERQVSGPAIGRTVNQKSCLGHCSCIARRAAGFSGGARPEGQGTDRFRANPTFPVGGRATIEN